MLLRLAALAALPFLAACATTAPPTCPGGASPTPVAELVFGRNIRASLGVTEAEWRAFLDAEVTPRFPDGLTVLAGRGQYRMADGSIVEEGTRLIVLLYPSAPPARAAHEASIAAITREYKRRFDQEAVLRVSAAVQALVR